MLVNSQPADTLSIKDRGLLYGDGVFETILCEAGRPILLAGHTQRLENGCKRRYTDTSTTADNCLMKKHILKCTGKHV